MPIVTKTKQTQAAPSTGAAKRAASKRGRTPTKENINLATIGVKRTRWGLGILVLVVILIAAAAIGKFLVYDRLTAVSAAESEAAEVKRQIDATQAKIDEYGELNELFAHYTYTGMTSEEQNRVDRVAVMELIERIVMPQMDVNSWTLSGNRLQMTVQADTLQRINLTAQKLLEDDMVSYCAVNTATTDSKTKLANETTEKVAASIIVYLMKPKEVAGK